MDTESNFLHLSKGKIWYKKVGNGKGTPLLILHGGPGYPSDYLFNLEVLGDEQKVIFYDQLDCGRSERVGDKANWNIEYYVKELAEIREKLKLDAVHILGHSWGTILANEYMHTHPYGVQSVVFADPCIGIPLWCLATENYLDNLPNNYGKIIREYERQGHKDNPLYKEAVLYYSNHHECTMYPRPESMQASAAHMGKEVYAYMWGPNEYTATGTLKEYDGSEYLRELHTPALFMCGRTGGDSPEVTEKYHNLTPGSEIKIFEHSSHMPNLEEPAEFVHTVEEFIKKYD